MHCTVKNGMSDVVPQIEGARKQNVYSGNFRYSIYLKRPISAT